MVLKTCEEKIIDIPEAIIHCRPDSIIHIDFKEDTELDVELQMRLVKIYADICGDTKRPFLFSSKNGIIFTKEARENSDKIEHLYPALATAIIAKALAPRLIANFFLKINKPKTPYRIFKDISSAITWLENYFE